MKKRVLLSLLLSLAISSYAAVVAQGVVGVSANGSYSAKQGLCYIARAKQAMSGVEDESPLVYDLAQNYPNPFNPTTTINFSLVNDQNVVVKIYNVLGSEVATIAKGAYPKGHHSVQFNAAQLSSGQYFYKIETPEFSKVKKMLLLK